MRREAEAARARAGLYWLVARLVASEPNEALLQELNTPAFRETATTFGLSPPPVPARTDAQRTYEAWAAEYTRLFLLPASPLHPYESVQRGEGQLWGEAAGAAQQAYREAGFALQPEAHQIPDHLAVELEFMAHLATQEAERWEAGAREGAEALRERQRAFLREHPGRWAVDFAHTLKAETADRYYRFVADLLGTVIASDASFLDVPIGG